MPDEFRNAPGSATEDDSKTLDESLVSNILTTTLSAPFACRAENQTRQLGIRQLGIEAVFYCPDDSGFEFDSNFYSTNLSGAGNFSECMHFVFSYALIMFIKLTSNEAGTAIPQLNATQDYSSIHESDIAWFGESYTIWINHTRPVVVVVQNEDGGPLGSPTPPDNTFPFTRLASITLADDSYTYLYHQINGTTLAEEQWDNTVGAWTATEYISISYSWRRRCCIRPEIRRFGECKNGLLLTWRSRNVRMTAGGG